MSDQDREDLFETAKELLQRTNNFLTTCLTHAEGALETEDVQELIDALRQITAGARSMSTFSQGARARLSAVRPLQERKSA